MEKEPTQDLNIFESAWTRLSEDEKKAITYTHFHHSGEEEHKLPEQDELVESAKEKLSKAGVDIENLDQYLEKK